MRLSTVFELLVIALLIAFAASRVIDGPDRSKALSRDHRFTVGRQSQDPPARHCTCSSLTCNCCRDFSLPIVPVKGPGCATVSYLHDDAMMITMSFGDRVLRNITVDSKKPKPICMGMPGGISKFCGRLYNIKKEGEDFKACLGLELRALDDVEAALRVSCFKFGPSGVNVEPGEAVPAEKSKEDEYDDDDDYGLGGLDDDDDDDDDDFGLTGGEDDEDEDEDEENPPAKDTYNYVDSSDSDADYTGLSSLSEELFGGLFGSSSKKKKPIKSQDEVYVSNPPKLQQQGDSQSAPPQVNLVVMQPVILPTSKPPRRAAQKKPVKKPAKVNPTPITPSKIATTPTPVKKIKTTPSPVRTLAPSTTPSVTPSTTAPTKKKKKKKPSRRRNTTTAKPITKNSTDENPTIVTTTTMTVNVVQGGVNLNNTKPQPVENPNFDAPLKIPMSQPVVETKPIKQSHNPLITNVQESVPQSVEESSYTEKVVNEANEPTEVNESTTQTIMQNTIPTNDNFNEVHLINNDQVTIKTLQEQQNGEFGIENVINTTPSAWYSAEDTTNQETTVQEVLSTYTNNNFENIMRNPEKSTTLIFETTEDSSDMVYDTTDSSTKRIDDDEIIRLGTVIENTETTQPLSSATVSYDVVEEGTDKTEVLTNDNSSTQETSSEQENESTEDDDEDDDSDIDFGADLGLDDDDEEEEEENNQKKNHKDSLIELKPEEKDDDDEDDILGGLLDDEDEDDSKTKEEERGFQYNPPYKINPLLFRLARVSTGSIATARHLPRFSDGRNRRNNKRMRFPSLEVIP